MSIIGITGLALGAASLAAGVSGQREASKEQERLLRNQAAANEAWYNRAYYEDYLNSAGAQAALKRVRDAWSKEARQARARQAVTGGTPEQAAAVAQAGGEAMGNTVAQLAAAGEQNKREVAAQKAQMDANIAAQRGAIAEARQQAGANLAANAASMIGSAAQMMDAPKAGGAQYKAAPLETTPISQAKIDADVSELLKRPTLKDLLEMSPVGPGYKNGKSTNY